MEIESRRPLKTRSSAWARRLAGKLAAAGISPNGISACSVVAAAAGGAAFLAAARGWLPWAVAWPLGALCIQLRLLCNLMDGMVAIEGGRKSATGELWNEIPDRLADSVLIFCAAWAVGWPWWGALAAWAAVMSAYVRAIGASLGAGQDFCGPLAKPHRMAVLTLGALTTAFDSLWNGDGLVMKTAMVLIAAGTILTVVRRIMRLAKFLKEGRP